jgi:hypothetical protein
MAKAIIKITDQDEDGTLWGFVKSEDTPIEDGYSVWGKTFELFKEDARRVAGELNLDMPDDITAWAGK